MLKFLKKIFVNDNLNQNELEDKGRKDFFRNHLYEHQNDSPTYEAMYIVFNGFDLELSNLINKNQLTIDFDYIEKDDYYEVMIEKFEKKHTFYITIGRQGIKDSMILESQKDILDASKMNTKDIIDVLIKEIIRYFE